ncbi:MAG TPA: KH domain-containing protein [Candidatus Nanoarchaeia archaeon]|nr:KH domain-containing protein [Candidatus Nanoarchaeia archaeon]
MFSSETRIPKARVAILIGKKGATKRDIEKRLNLKIEVTPDGDVTVNGEDSFENYIAIKIIKAIGRGFNPKIALYLINDQYLLEIINIKDYVGNSKVKMQRMKSRVIGTQGKAWKMIEKMTDTNISVFGKTVSIIGLNEDVEIAKQAIDKLLHGADHGKMFEFIERQKARHF